MKANYVCVDHHNYEAITGTPGEKTTHEPIDYVSVDDVKIRIDVRITPRYTVVRSYKTFEYDVETDIKNNNGIIVSA